jgi:outer membrane immunogenic protein
MDFELEETIMKNMTLAIVSALMLAAPAAQAADMALKAPPPPAPVDTWTGFYIGGNAGYAWGHFDPTSNFTCPTGSAANSCAYSFPANLATVNNAAKGSRSVQGFTGGVEAGYNWQLNSAVIGIESDFGAFHLKGSLSATGAFPSASTNYAVNVSANTDWLYTFRGRLGWTVTPTTLFYATGGLAVTQIHVSNAFTDNFATLTAGASNTSTTKAGWTLGGGVEQALNRNWTIKAEYLYVDFGSAAGTTLVTNTIPGVVGPDVLNTSTHWRANIARAGVNYKF